MLEQKLQQKLLQKLSPQQIQLMKLLQVPALLLEQRIKQEIEENPALEEGADNYDEPDMPEGNDYDDKPDIDNEGADDYDEPEHSPDDEFDISDYIDDDETPAYRLSAGNNSSDDETREIPFASGISFLDYLHSQLGLKKLTEKELQIAELIIGNIDESGYLHRDIHALIDDLAFNLNIKADFREVLTVIRMIQEFDPPGVAARDLQECLLIQLKRVVPQTRSVANARLLLEKSFTDFTKRHYDKIRRKHGFREEDLKDAIEEILKMNPKPGSAFQNIDRESQYIVPDFIVTNLGGELELTLTSRNAPDLRVNRSYAEMLETMALSQNKSSTRQREAIMFVKQKLDSAKWFIDAIKQRQNTLILTMEAILNYQREYFLTGDETTLRPMILKDIADIVKLDISTISRVANSKYAQTPYGTFLLKTFFSESLQTDSGEEVSTREVKKILQDFIESEDKTRPLTDDELAAVLNEKGYNIARRTVAKYREQLDIPVARLRKELVLK